jgi:hypothetical protein
MVKIGDFTSPQNQLLQGTDDYREKVSIMRIVLFHLFLYGSGLGGSFNIFSKRLTALQSVFIDKKTAFWH